MDKPRGRPFQPGNTFGRGRPKGSRNKAKRESQQLLDQYAPMIVKKVIHEAMHGNSTALKLCAERILPLKQAGSVSITLPRVRTVQDAALAGNRLIHAVNKGSITAVEAETLMGVLLKEAELIQNSGFELRLESLEKRIADGGLDRQDPAKADGNLIGGAQFEARKAEMEENIRRDLKSAIDKDAPEVKRSA